jgi:hypothetical protein
MTTYPVIKLLDGGWTAVQATEQKSREVSVSYRVGADGTLTAQIVNGLDLDPSPIRLTAAIETR